MAEKEKKKILEARSEDLGDDAVLASDYGIKNLKRVVPNLIEWTYQPNDAYDNLSDMHKAVVKQYSLYLYHVLKYIGNNYVTKRTVEEKGLVYQPVPKAKVKAAIDYWEDNCLLLLFGCIPKILSS